LSFRIPFDCLPQPVFFDPVVVGVPSSGSHQKVCVVLVPNTVR
jgi:hypothetical protein